MRYVFLKDKFVLETEASLSVFDSSITTGDRTTEVARTFLQKPFKLDSHLERLFNGMRELNMNLEISKEEIINRTYELLEMNCKTEEANVEFQIVYIVTRGLETLFKLFEPSECNPTLIILCFPLKYRVASMLKKYIDGVKLLVPSQRAIPNNLMSPQIKSRGRVHLKMAQLEIRQRDKEASAILLDDNNNITESTGANIFFVKGCSLYTPPIESILPGITRDYIIGLARELGMEVHEENISINDIDKFSECFITSTVIAIQHVRQLEDTVYSDGICGEMTNKIRNLFYEKVGVDFVKQARDYAEALKS